MSRPDHFARFGLPVAYDLNLADLADRYRAAQHQIHPDRHAGGSVEQQQSAVRMTADLNEAYTVLRSPLARAEYLLNLKGIDDPGGSATIQDVALLEEQMELRECLADVRNAAEPSRAFNELQSQVQARYRDQQQAFTAAFAEEDLPRAAKAVTAMQFHAKLLRELQDLAEVLDDEAHG